MDPYDPLHSGSWHSCISTTVCPLILMGHGPSVSLRDIFTLEPFSWSGMYSSYFIPMHLSELHLCLGQSFRLPPQNQLPPKGIWDK